MVRSSLRAGGVSRNRSTPQASLNDEIKGSPHVDGLVRAAIAPAHTGQRSNYVEANSWPPATGSEDSNMHAPDPATDNRAQWPCSTMCIWRNALEVNTTEGT